MMLFLKAIKMKNIFLVIRIFTIIECRDFVLLNILGKNLLLNVFFKMKYL
jgi:hypothetical protein